MTSRKVRVVWSGVGRRIASPSVSDSGASTASKTVTTTVIISARHSGCRRYNSSLIVIQNASNSPSRACQRVLPLCFDYYCRFVESNQAPYDSLVLLNRVSPTSDAAAYTWNRNVDTPRIVAAASARILTVSRARPHLHPRGPRCRRRHRGYL